MAVAVIVVVVGLTLFQRLDADMDPISALIGAGASLLGGFMNSSSTGAINAANLQAQQANLSGAYLPQLVSNAKKAGLNPLAVLGNTSAGSPVQVGTDPGAGAMQAGRILSEMKMPGADKEAELRQQLTQAQIDQTNAETQRTVIASHLALASQPGRGPKVVAGQDAAHPIPAFAWYSDDKGRPFMGQTREFSGSQFGLGAVVPGAIAFGKELGENVFQAGYQVGDDIRGMLPTVSPGVLRYFNNVGSVLGQ